MSEQNKDVKASTITVDSGKVQIDQIPLDKLAEWGSDVARHGVRKPTPMIGDTNELAEEVIYLLAGHKLSAWKAGAVLDKAKELVAEYARLYRRQD